MAHGIKSSKMETTATTATKVVGYAIAAYIAYKLGLELWCFVYGLVY